MVLGFVVVFVFVIVLKFVAAVFGVAEEAVEAGADGGVYDTAKGMIASQSSFSFSPPAALPSTGGARYTSHRRGFLFKSTLTRGVGGIHVPFAIASATMRRWRRRSSSERTTIAEETPRRRMSVARKVYR